MASIFVCGKSEDPVSSCTAWYRRARGFAATSPRGVVAPRLTIVILLPFIQQRLQQYVDLRQPGLPAWRGRLFAREWLLAYPAVAVSLGLLLSDLVSLKKGPQTLPSFVVGHGKTFFLCDQTLNLLLS